jgi:FeS assembly SUF system regulator
MIRIAKLTDYGVVLMAALARQGSDRLCTVADLTATTSIPQPTVSKLLKILASSELLQSVRGARGGYRLARAPEQITVADVVTALQGPIALVECLSESSLCEHEADCTLKGPWERINRVLRAALEEMTLADVAGSPGGPRLRGASDVGKSADAGGRGARR